MAIKDNETTFRRTAVEYLLVLGIPAWVNNSGCTKIGKRFIRFGKEGSSDILGCLPKSGRMLAVECKSEKGKPTPAQVQFMDAINEAGGLAFVARSLDDIEDKLREAGFKA